MDKQFVIFGILYVFCIVLTKGFDKDEAIADFFKKLDKCKEEVGAKDSDIEEIFTKSPSSTMEGQCLRACIMKLYETMDNNGKFIKEVALSHAQEYLSGDDKKISIITEILGICSEINVTDDHCEAAEQYGKCMREEAKARNFKHEFQF